MMTVLRLPGAFTTAATRNGAIERVGYKVLIIRFSCLPPHPGCPPGSQRVATSAQAPSRTTCCLHLWSLATSAALKRLAVPCTQHIKQFVPLCHATVEICVLGSDEITTRISSRSRIPSSNRQKSKQYHLTRSSAPFHPLFLR